MGMLYSLLSVICMATMPVVNKFILQTSSPAFSALINALFAFVFFAILAGRRKNRLSFQFNIPSVASGIGNGLGLVFLFLALQNMHPALMGLVSRLSVVFSLGLSVVFLKQWPDKIEILLGLLAVLGTLGAALSGTNDSTQVGVLFAFASTLSFSVSNISLKFASHRATNSEVLMTVNLISSAIILLFCLASAESLKIPHDTKSWVLIFAGAFVGSCLGFWFYIEGLKYLKFSRASLLRTTSPLFTAAFAFPFFGLQFNFIQVSSAFILLISIVLLTVHESRKKVKSLLKVEALEFLPQDPALRVG